MSDLGWQQYVDGQEQAHYLDSLTVSKTQDEFGQARYFVTDFEGDWIGEPYDTPELAFAEIDRMRRA